MPIPEKIGGGEQSRGSFQEAKHRAEKLARERCIVIEPAAYRKMTARCVIDNVSRLRQKEMAGGTEAPVHGSSEVDPR